MHSFLPDMDHFINALGDYSIGASHVESVLIVGSYARGTNQENSDIDVVIITSDKAGMLANPAFTEQFGEIMKRQTEYYGACTSIRVWYRDGKEVEFGIVEPSWIATPLDRGTYRVLSDGFQIITDKNQYFKDLKLESPDLPV